MAARQQTCSICMDSFKNPKLISCHHSFCLNCLEDYVRAKVRNGRFNCPICRTSVELPKGGVLGFQSNFYIDDTVSGEKFACDLCGPKNVACSRCLDCEENLCQTCCYGHEKSKASRHHKISDLGTLDIATKGKIRQHIFCDQHPEDEIRLFCSDCKVLICIMCKAVNHENHTSRTVADYAAAIKKILRKKKDKCSEKLRRMNNSKAMAEELDRKINDAEREEIKAVEEQHLKLKKVLEQEMANVKGRIKSVYHDLRQQIVEFKHCVEDECVTCYNAQENVQKITEQGTDIDIIRNGPNLEKLISASMSKTDPTHTTGLKNKLFSPAPIDASKLIPLIGIVQDSTDATPEEEYEETPEEEYEETPEEDNEEEYEETPEEDNEEEYEETPEEDNEEDNEETPEEPQRRRRIANETPEEPQRRRRRLSRSDEEIAFLVPAPPWFQRR